MPEFRSVWQRLLILSLSAFLISACVARLAYNTMDYWIPWYLDDYVSLTSAQESRFIQEFRQAQAIHRRQELPRVHQAITALQRDLAQPMTTAQIEGYHHSFTGLGEDSITVFTPPVGNLLRYLSNIQVEQINTQVNQDLDELRTKREKLTQEEKLERYRTRFEKISREWIGSLTDEQSAMIAELAQYQLEIEPVFFSVRQGLYQQWQQLMTERHRPEFEGKLEKLLQDMLAFRYAPVQSQFDRYLQRRFELLARLNQSLSAKQRQHFIDKLTEIRKDIAVLIQR
ncbi:DUF6279 family lipoprotein [Photobacterium sp. 1_MG-2023]|uniref:DUF6279 family lipoprotein n=1 Tax=Photobacterium sp. 1_MG-2023 TaxID=3062646 RepID=UPI0026E2C2CD|nr:DUF6279 family lipoprotein [Photobacterium sp. 1_MG-2023]MDO6707330.1 DUF6279 family lipoprotein [Photobacterium sp. 1_MG-2023]